jgi:hypothetical protein
MMRAADLRADGRWGGEEPRVRRKMREEAEVERGSGREGEWEEECCRKIKDRSEIQPY